MGNFLLGEGGGGGCLSAINKKVLNDLYLQVFGLYFHLEKLTQLRCYISYNRMYLYVIRNIFMLNCTSLSYYACNFLCYQILKCNANFKFNAICTGWPPDQNVGHVQVLQLCHQRNIPHPVPYGMTLQLCSNINDGRYGHLLSDGNNPSVERNRPAIHKGLLWQT